MADGLRSIHVLTTDDGLAASAKEAAQGLDGWECRTRDRVQTLVDEPPGSGDVLLLDAHWPEESVYELARRLTGRTRCRTYLLVEPGNVWALQIAHFCGATGILPRTLEAGPLADALAGAGGPRPALLTEVRGVVGAEPKLPEALLRDLTGGSSEHLIRTLTDPETALFNFEFLQFKLDEEFKRAQRFEYPLSCVMLGFEGQASEEVLRELAGLFLHASRDTDILGRFDESSFLFLLPHTGPDGARVMARRVTESTRERGLSDLVGDPLEIAVGISFCPHGSVHRREDLFGNARDAFRKAQLEGGGVVTTS